MDLNDLKGILGGFHHAESICDTLEAIRSTFNLFPIKILISSDAEHQIRYYYQLKQTPIILLRFGAFSMMFVLKHMLSRSTKSVEVLAVSLIECNKVKTVIERWPPHIFINHG